MAEEEQVVVPVPRDGLGKSQEVIDPMIDGENHLRLLYPDGLLCPSEDLRSLTFDVELEDGGPAVDEDVVDGIERS